MNAQPWDADLPDLDTLAAEGAAYLANLEARTRQLMAVALCVRDDAPGVRFPDRAAALDYLGQEGDDVAIDQAAIDEYFAHMERTDPFMQAEE